ncbi:hypothetical protein E2562_013857 [Oryza meyeriana var. granulata]|uniref:Phenylalanyl-tRNA synthetase domain-containing protein n=1 Tax=Oryza meyeriana var. granulata TaxID=110450 RepID=A0A6G1F8E0_9ORYZ|nr:hypothetical protein E2562_013857 [Oryza meyeriana var. granulata]
MAQSQIYRARPCFPQLPSNLRTSPRRLPAPWRTSPRRTWRPASFAHLNSGGEIPDSRSYASSLGVTHGELEDVIKSLSAFRIVESTLTKDTWVLTEEAKGYVASGSPEAQLVAAIPPEGASKDVLKEKLGSIFDIGMKTAAKNEWIGFEKGNKDLVFRKVDTFKDELQEQLKRLYSGEVLFDKVIDDLKRRKLITKEKSIWYALKKGPQFVAKREKFATDLRQEHLRSGDWKNLEFKDYNFGAQGQPIDIGYVQPLLEVREEIKNIFLQMGYTDNDVNKTTIQNDCYFFVSFWNFDALFQPRQHPSRDSHDTFFLEAPAATKQLPEDYLEKVKEVHQCSGYGSKGYHKGLKKWVEVGNSGMFRPEMLLPMGLPEGVSVIAWGLSLERPTMILSGIDNIRDLFGPKVDFNLIKSSPLCHLEL